MASKKGVIDTPFDDAIASPNGLKSPAPALPKGSKK